MLMTHAFAGDHCEDVVVRDRVRRHGQQQPPAPAPRPKRRHAGGGGYTAGGAAVSLVCGNRRTTRGAGPSAARTRRSAPPRAGPTCSVRGRGREAEAGAALIRMTPRSPFLGAVHMGGQGREGGEGRSALSQTGGRGHALVGAWRAGALTVCRASAPPRTLRPVRGSAPTACAPPRPQASPPRLRPRGRL